jgi:dihydrofolate reductase
MARFRVEGFTISLDGYGAGPHQDIANPLGVGGTELHRWLRPTRTFQRALFGADGGATGIDDEFAARGFRDIGAWLLGRNMFGPIRGPWPDTNWTGWWGDTPPYRVPVFVLTHHARPSLAPVHIRTPGSPRRQGRCRTGAARRPDHRFARCLRPGDRTVRTRAPRPERWMRQSAYRDPPRCRSNQSTARSVACSRAVE